jgi:hypothetical protein
MDLDQRLWKQHDWYTQECSDEDIELDDILRSVSYLSPHRATSISLVAGFAHAESN